MNCTTITELQTLTITMVQTGTLLLAFIGNALSMFLTGYFYCCRTISVERTERLFVYITFFTTLSTFIQTFQWVSYFNGGVANISCTIVAMLNLYSTVATVLITSCVGAHLLILLWQPKCLKVINEAKVRIYKQLEWAYLSVSAFLPIFFLPWPFINNRYGDTGAYCWIKSMTDDCRPAYDGIAEQIVMWYALAFAVFVFTSIVVVVVMVVVCIYAKKKGDANIYTIIGYLLLSVVTGLFFVSLRIIDWAGGTTYPIRLAQASIISFDYLVRSLVFIVRTAVSCSMFRKSTPKVKCNEITRHVAERSPSAPPSHTLFVPLHEDDLDSLGSHAPYERFICITASSGKTI